VHLQVHVNAARCCVLGYLPQGMAHVLDDDVLVGALREHVAENADARTADIGRQIGVLLGAVDLLLALRIIKELEATAGRYAGYWQARGLALVLDRSPLLGRALKFDTVLVVGLGSEFDAVDLGTMEDPDQLVERECLAQIEGQ